MRALLEGLYRGAGILSGICIVSICLIILARVIGRWLGIVVPSSDDFAGYLLAAASFLALAYTFRQGGHIRVSLFTSRLAETSMIKVERGVLLVASVLVVYLAYQLGFMVWESWDFEEVTSGYVPMPLWLVQLPMAVGMVVFAIAVIDQTLCHFLYGTRIPKSEEESLAESQKIELDNVVPNSRGQRMNEMLIGVVLLVMLLRYLPAGCGLRCLW